MNRSRQSRSERSKTAGSDFLRLSVHEVPARGLADWLAGQLRVAIADGRLPVGATLPATRVLADELGVSRGVVTESYRRLIEDGRAAGCGRAGTKIVAAPAPVPPVRSRATRSPAPDRAEGPFGAAPGADVFDALRATPARIDLSPGLPDLGASPGPAGCVPSVRCSRSCAPPTSATGTRAAHRPCAGPWRPGWRVTEVSRWTRVRWSSSPVWPRR
ncbi:MAG TPA: GntR family transcriptional regulator [Pseudonocardia sp.]|uniref:GntR family transcriptional regulator n=1 Tax=Pseudonocardia sp. TaxID=60912 RepID=UPI002F414EF4